MSFRLFDMTFSFSENEGQIELALEYNTDLYKETFIKQFIQHFENLLSEYKKAPEVTRERMYLDAVQDVMSTSSKVLIDVEGGNNMMYLPLDKLTQHRTESGSGMVPTMSNMNISDIADEVIKKLRREQSVNRSRGTR